MTPHISRITSAIVGMALFIPLIAFGQARSMKVTVFLVDPEATLTRAVDTAAGEVANDFGDILVPIKRTIPRTSGVLKATLKELFSFSNTFVGQSGLYTALSQNQLDVAASTRVDKDIAYVDLTGSLQIGGIGDIARYNAQIEETVRANTKNVEYVYVTLNGKRSEWLAYADARGRADQREWPALDETFNTLRNAKVAGFRFLLTEMETPPDIVNDEATITFDGWFVRTKGPKTQKVNIDAFLKGIADTLKQNHQLTSVTFVMNGITKTY